MNEFIEECKEVLAECRKSGVYVVVNGILFPSDLDFDFDENLQKLFIGFHCADISGYVARVPFSDIRSFE